MREKNRKQRSGYLAEIQQSAVLLTGTSISDETSQHQDVLDLWDNSCIFSQPFTLYLMSY